MADFVVRQSQIALHIFFIFQGLLLELKIYYFSCTMVSGVAPYLGAIGRG